jgi:hypothetical protein
VLKIGQGWRSIASPADTQRMALDHRRASRPMSVLIGAFAGGTIGFLAGALVIDWIDPGPPDL